MAVDNFPYARLGLAKTLAEVRADMFARLDEVQADYAAQGWLPAALNLNRGPARGLIELANWGRFKVNQDVTALIPQCFAAYATGSWLDLHAADVLLTRKPALQAAGQVLFTRQNTSGNLKIPAGRLVRTKPDGLGEVYRFVTTAEVIMAEGAASAAAGVTAETYGQAANVTAGAICEIVTAIGGVDGVTNPAGWLTTEGADEESDDSLRRRIFLQWRAISGLNKYFYESLALSVPGVAVVKILDQHPRGQGTVDVIIMGAAGLPTAGLIDQVAAVIEENRPQNDNVLVLAPETVPVDLDITLRLTSGDPAAICAEAEGRLRALFAAPAKSLGVELLGIGEDLTPSRIIYEAMKSAGVKSVAVSRPAAEVVVPQGGLAVLRSLTISSELVEE